MASDAEARPCDRQSQEILSLRALLSRDLRIPTYQRPYKWSVKNVAQLLDDISTFTRRDRYRVGTVILHRNSAGKLDIVDGQQRVLTISVLLHAIEAIEAEARTHATGHPSPPNPDLPAHGLSTSAENLRNAFDHVVEFLSERERPSEWVDQVLDKCEVVVITLDNVDEAFQMFDSQNTRGKALYPTDLLKAYHIREMEAGGIDRAGKLEIVMSWEAMPPDERDSLFSDYLFKIKCWSNGLEVPDTGFSTADIDLFKGIREPSHGTTAAEWMRALLYAKNFTDDYRQQNATLIRYGALPALAFPYQIDQSTINGQPFFEMARHYFDLSTDLGLANTNPEIPLPPPAVMPGLHHYIEQKGRKSTLRLTRNLFEAALLYYTDRFGSESSETATRHLARWAFAIRVQQERVTRAMIDRYARGERQYEGLKPRAIFREIRLATAPHDLLRVRLDVPVSKSEGRYDDLQQALSAAKTETQS